MLIAIQCNRPILKRCSRFIILINFAESSLSSQWCNHFLLLSNKLLYSCIFVLANSGMFLCALQITVGVTDNYIPLCNFRFKAQWRLQRSKEAQPTGSKALAALKQGRGPPRTAVAAAAQQSQQEWGCTTSRKACASQFSC